MSYFKCTATLRRRTDFDLEAFSRHWRTVHRELALRLVPPGIMRGYVQNHRIEPALGVLEPAGDGAPELWVDSPQQVERLGASREYQEGARPDEANFMSGDARMMVGRETVLIADADRARAGDLTKAMIFAPRSAGQLAGDASTSETLEDLCDALCRGPAPLRLSHERSTEAPASLGEPAYDWILSAWWKDANELEKAWALAERALGRRAGHIQGMRIHEMIVLLPPT